MKSLRLMHSTPIAYPLLRLLSFQHEILIYHDDMDDMMGTTTKTGFSVMDEDDARNRNISSLIKMIGHDLASVPRPIKFDDFILRRFYSLDDFNDEFILVHGQRGFGVVARADGHVTREIADLDAIVLTDADRERDARFKAANEQRYEMHALFEYLNLKLYREFVVVATWSKLCVFDAASLCCYVKADLYSFASPNNFYLPNRMFVSKHGQLVFYDSGNLLLTFI